MLPARMRHAEGAEAALETFKEEEAARGYIPLKRKLKLPLHCIGRSKSPACKGFAVRGGLQEKYLFVHGNFYSGADPETLKAKFISEFRRK